VKKFTFNVVFRTFIITLFIYNDRPPKTKKTLRLYKG